MCGQRMNGRRNREHVWAEDEKEEDSGICVGIEGAAHGIEEKQDETKSISPHLKITR